MRLRSGLYPKTTLQTQPGEWVRLDTHVGPVIAWITAVALPQGREMMVFDLSGVEQPRILAWTLDTFCLSFGMDCVIEPVGFTEAYAPREQFANTPGVLSIASSGSYLSAIDLRAHWRDVVALDIDTGVIRQQFGQHEGLFRSWKLWTDDAARLSPKEEPLLEFSVALPA